MSDRGHGAVLRAHGAGSVGEIGFASQNRPFIIAHEAPSDGGVDQKAKVLNDFIGAVSPQQGLTDHPAVSQRILDLILQRRQGKA